MPPIEPLTAVKTCDLNFIFFLLLRCLPIPERSEAFWSRRAERSEGQAAEGASLGGGAAMSVLLGERNGWPPIPGFRLAEIRRRFRQPKVVFLRGGPGPPRAQRAQRGVPGPGETSKGFCPPRGTRERSEPRGRQEPARQRRPRNTLSGVWRECYGKG